ncbi:hypothetical protein SAMN06298212_13715 [Ruaniaceae bacterium KH17]|nr:hypothetical protein SAMN06298212_13715 [Ruaniaceae bacterium KH17]
MSVRLGERIPVLESFARGATVERAAAAAGLDAELAELAAEHFSRLGVVQLPKACGESCGSPSASLACKGCPFAK